MYSKKRGSKTGRNVLVTTLLGKHLHVLNGGASVWWCGAWGIKTVELDSGPIH